MQGGVEVAAFTEGAVQVQILPTAATNDRLPPNHRTSKYQDSNIEQPLP